MYVSKNQTQVQMDAQIAFSLQAEEQVKEQCQSFLTDRQANQLAHASQEQNRQYPS